MDTVQLEKLAVRKLKMSAKQAMDIAEKLYNKGYISYPRTETNKFPSNMNLSALVGQLTTSPKWGDFAAEMRIGGETFHAFGLCVRDLGYLRVYIYDKWGDKVLPIYMEGEELTDYRLRIADGQTQPPELLNEGRYRFFNLRVSPFQTRQYVGVRDDGRFIPGFLGLALVDGYDAMGYAMSKPQLRADLERQLQAICAGERTKQEVLSEQLEKYKRIFVQTEVKINLLSEAFARYKVNVYDNDVEKVL
ncbi:DNA topoisomerase [Teladorsagia circumcincta]|uniref:DNA topoisomerase n=1 Tax=Teladorsagia circumcincta TaxID=45464 RepID=A0A2G9UER1_TELCI|nr:DNA topoisomerase [Teladorsagia circumcincta]